MASFKTNLLARLNAVTDQDLEKENKFPQRPEVIDLLKYAQVVILPEFFQYHNYSQEEAYDGLVNSLLRQMTSAYRFLDEAAEIDIKLQMYLQKLPEIKRLVLTDIQAIYDGDPAAKSKSEVVICYPGFYAIFIYRLAHELYDMGVPYLPRIMTEYAHEKTGIDINPGARIGEYFCIDHGTGIVIGETAVIGKHVKLYQGVTIGAKSFELDENGHPVKGGKRHPNIGNNVVIYANATILGGTTTIGNDCVIGGNVWLLHSVPDGQKVYYPQTSA